MTVTNNNNNNRSSSSSQKQKERPKIQQQLGPTIDEMTSFHASFCSDDITYIEFIPSFDLPNKMNIFISTIPIGPFIAGITTIVPIWIGIYFHQRSLGTIIAPSWLSITNITKIILYEKKNGSLYHNVQLLPLNYYEISHRIIKLIKTSSTNMNSKSTIISSASDTNNNIDAIELLIQDLFDIRIDKLRKQFQDLSSNHLVNKNNEDINEGNNMIDSENATSLIVKNMVINITGIGTQERAILKQFISKAMTDYYYLVRTTPSPSITTTTASNNNNSRTTNDDDYNVSTTTATTNSRRIRIHPITTDDNNDENVVIDVNNNDDDDNEVVKKTADDDATTAAATTTTRRPLRRFRE